jgi:hypothetical protein
MAPREATDGHVVRERYHTIAGDAIQLFQLIVINPAPIPIIYGTIETLLAEPHYISLLGNNPTGLRQAPYQATEAEIKSRIEETHGDLRYAIGVAIAASTWLAAHLDDPQVREIHHLLGQALTTIRGLSTVMMRLHQARLVALRGSTVAIPARPSYLPLFGVAGRQSTSHPHERIAAGASAESSAAPSQPKRQADLTDLRSRRRAAHASRQRAKGVFSFVTRPQPEVVVRQQAAGILSGRSSQSGMGSRAAR